MAGWYRMWRGWQNNPVFKQEPYTEREAWEWLIASAVYKPTPIQVGGKPYILNRGQLTYSLRFMAEAWKWQKSTVERYLCKLRDWAMITSEVGTFQSIITICNYDKYQTLRDKNEPEIETTAGHYQNESGPNKKEDKEMKKGKKGSNYLLCPELVALRAEIDEAFQRIWNTYIGRGMNGEEGEGFKGSQKSALEKFSEIYLQVHETDREVLVEAIIHGCAQYAHFISIANRSSKHLVTWLDAEGWKDDYAIS